MSNKYKFHREARDAALQRLLTYSSEHTFIPEGMWQSAVEDSGYSLRYLRKLFEEHRALGRDTLDPEILRSGFEVDDDTMHAVFLTCGNVQAAHRLLDKEGWGALPSVRHFRRCVKNALGEQGLMYAKKGSAGARSSQVYLAMRPVHRGEVFELDHTELPTYVVPKGKKVAEKPWLTICLEVSARYPLGWVLTFGKPSAQEVRACLASAITKRYAPDGKTLVGGVAHRWVWDRGLEFLSDDISQACARLGALPMALPAYCPHLKPHIERFNGFVKRDCLPTLPGYTDGGADLRGQQAIATAAMSEESFLERLDEWMNWYITEHVHSSLGMTPLEAWQSDSTPVRFVSDSQLWEDFMRAKEHVKVSKNGIRFETNDYTAPELSKYVGRKVEVRFLPSDRTFIEVFIDGDHLCTAFDRLNLTIDQEKAVINHRKKLRKENQQRFTASNRLRRESNPDHSLIVRNKKGKMVVRPDREDESEDVMPLRPDPQGLDELLDLRDDEDDPQIPFEFAS